MKISKLFLVSLLILAGYLAGSATCQMQAAQDYNVSTLAGKAGSPGSADGTGSAAQFNWPRGVAVDSAGNLYVADSENFTIRMIGPSGVVTTLAGLAGNQGSADGTGSAARFLQPYGVAVDTTGNVYVADYGNSTIQKIGPGAVVTTLAGLAGNPGSADGMGSAARFFRPYGLAVDTTGNLYVADSGNSTIRKIEPDGMVTTLAGLASHPASTSETNSVDGTGSVARFEYPMGVAADNAGNLYVTDTLASTIRQIGPGAVVTTLAGQPSFGPVASVDGTGGAARFYEPAGVAVDKAGNLYVTDTRNHTIRKLAKACPDVPGIDLAAGPVGEPRQLDASPRTANAWHWQILQQPSGSTNALSSPFIRNPVFIPDAEDHYVFQLSATNAAGQFGVRTLDFWACKAPVITMAPASQAAAQGDAIRLQVTARGLFLRCQWFKDGLPLPDQTDATLYLSNVQASATGNYSVVVSNPAGSWTSPSARLAVLVPTKVTLLPWSASPFDRTEGDTMEFTAVTSDAGSWHYQWSKNGADIIGATNAQLNLKNLRYFDSSQYRVSVWSETAFGSASVNLFVKGEYSVQTLAGYANWAWRSDGIGSAARFARPNEVAVDSAGNVYVADTDNSTIRKIAPGGVVTTLAGKAGSPGNADGTGSTAGFNGPSGVAVDSSGNIYVADSNNHTIRKIWPGAVVTTLAGVAGNSGSADGTGSAARFNTPARVTVDIAGNVYVADYSNHTIRRIGPGGVVTTLAGKAGSPGNVDGTGSTARFNGPAGVAVDSSGNIYVADSNNHTIRKIWPGAEVTTLAGVAGNSGSTDGMGSAARFSNPSGVAVDSAGNVYVADYRNHTIRQIGPGGVVTTLAGLAGGSGYADGMGNSARFNWPCGVAVDGAGTVYVADTSSHTIRVLTKINPDRPTIDSAIGPIGIARQLDTMPQEAARCAWQILQRPAGSTAELSSFSLRNPTFTPDKPGRYVFELATTDPSGAATTRTREFTAFDLGPIPPFSLRALRSGPTVVLAWTAASDYLLESAESLGSNAVWSPVPGVTTNTITLPLGVTNQYFRLRK